MVDHSFVLKIIGFSLVFCFGCGAPTDRPEDCSPSEYYNEVTELCTDCPAPRVDQCKEGCGFKIQRDNRGCPVVECTDECICGGGEYFAKETTSCQSCEEASDPPATCFESTGQDS